MHTRRPPAYELASAKVDYDADDAARAATLHIDNTLEDYRREIKRRVFG